MEKSINSHSIKVDSLKIMTTRLLILGLLLGLLMACGKTETTPTPAPAPVKSSEKQISDFQFTGIENNGVIVNIPGEIDEQGKAITVEMPSGTEITALEPNLEIPDKALYEPTGPQDFSSPINYTVTAEDGTSRTYLVTVDVALSQKEILLLISAANPGNTLDWKVADNPSDWEEVTLDGNGIITELIMLSKGLTLLPAEIGQLGSLEKLDLFNNNLSSLPPEIGQLGSLDVLRLTNNNLSSLAPEIWQLSSLKNLFLFGNDLSSLPPEIAQLSSLEVLDMTGNDLSSLPPEIGQLGSLENLFLDRINLSSLPPEIGQLADLNYLSLASNNLSSLPPEIGQLGSLTILSLASNNLSSLPTEITQLVNLKILQLENNNLSQFNHVPFIPSVTPSFGCSTETNLEILHLSGNPDLLLLNQCICDLDLDAGGTVNIDVVPDGVDCVGNNVISN